MTKKLADVSEKDWRALLGLNKSSKLKRNKKSRAHSQPAIVDDSASLPQPRIEKRCDRNSESRDTVIEKRGVRKELADVSEKDWRTLSGLDKSSTSKRNKNTGEHLKAAIVDDELDSPFDDSDASLPQPWIEKIGDSGSESRDTVIEKDSYSESRDTVIEKRGDRKELADVSEKDWRTLSGLDKSSTSKRNKNTGEHLKAAIVDDELDSPFDDSDASLPQPWIEKIGDSGSESRDTVIEKDSYSDSREAVIEKRGDRKKLMMKPQETLKFFKERLGFKTPTRVLVDGSVILDAIENKVHLRNIFQDALQDLDVELYTTNCVMKELKRYISKYSSSENMILFSELENELIIKCCGHTQECYPLDCVRGVVGEDNDYKFFVAMNDTRFSQQHKENLLIPIVSVDKGNFVIKNLSKKRMRHAQQLDFVRKPAIIDDSPLPYDDPDSPVYKRLMARLELYQFIQVSVHGDGNCMHRAISEQLSHSEKHYAEVRKLLVEQLRSNQELYEEGVKRLKRDPEHMGETYVEYVNRKSKDKVWEDPVNRQAAADRFHAKLVCLTSLENIAILEFFPNGLTEYQRVLYLCSLIGLHTDSMYPRTPHAESCSHCYPLGSPEKKKKERQRKDTV